MKQVLLIGIGPGDAEYLTVQAIRAINQVDVFFFLEKDGAGKDELLHLREEILRRYATEKPYRIATAKSPVRQTGPGRYCEQVADWHRAKRDVLAGLIRDELADGECGALLIWGDPALYDSTLTMLAGIREQTCGDLDYEVIPGITSVQALAAKHRITLNRIGEEIRITTARRLADTAPNAVQNAVVMLDSNAAFRQFADSELTIYWGAYLGTTDERLISGRLRDIAVELEEEVQRAKAEKGWIMDVYLLRNERRDD